MKAFMIALIGVAGVCAFVQAQPAAPKKAKLILDAIKVGEWVLLDTTIQGSGLIDLQIAEKPPNLTIQQYYATSAAGRDKARQDYAYEITTVGDDHIVVTDGDGLERHISKQAIRWIDRIAPKK